MQNHFFLSRDFYESVFGLILMIQADIKDKGISTGRRLFLIFSSEIKSVIMTLTDKYRTRQ